MSKQNGFQAGVAMIELIFSLVIMGIVLMSGPALLSQTTKSSMVAFQQESIAIVAAHTNALLTYAWDEQNTESQVAFTKRILRVTNGDTELNSVAGGRVIPGNRSFDPDPLAVATPHIGRDGNITTPDTDDDIDDFVENNLTLLIAGDPNALPNSGDYIDHNISINTAVTYIQDNAAYNTGTGAFAFSSPFNPVGAGITTNIKLVTVTLTSTSASEELKTKRMRLQAFMCNIGATKPDSSETAGILQNAPGGLF